MSEKEIPRCWVCGEPATRLCDAMVAFCTDPAARESEPFAVYTCDRPLCDRCTTEKMEGIMCSRGRGGGCRPIINDYCPEHRELRAEPAICATTGQAEAVRARFLLRLAEEDRGPEPGWLF